MGNSFSGEVILCIEDELDMRFFLKTLLETSGLEPVMARNGREGLAAAEKQLPDTIILDVMMPEKGGSQTYLDLKTDDRLATIPVIILSGVARATFLHYLDMLNLQRRTKIPEPDSYIQKPPEPKYLLRVIEKLLQKTES